MVQKSKNQNKEVNKENKTMDWEEMIEETESNDSGKDRLDRAVQEISEIKSIGEKMGTKVVDKNNSKKETERKKTGDSSKKSELEQIDIKKWLKLREF